MPFKLDPRVALRDTAYRLTYAEHVIQNEADEVESAITEEEPHHPNLHILATALQHLSVAQAHLLSAIQLLTTNEPSKNERPPSQPGG